MPHYDSPTPLHYLYTKPADVPFPGCDLAGNLIDEDAAQHADFHGDMRSCFATGTLTQGLCVVTDACSGRGPKLRCMDPSDTSHTWWITCDTLRTWRAYFMPRYTLGMTLHLLPQSAITPRDGKKPAAELIHGQRSMPGCDRCTGTHRYPMSDDPADLTCTISEPELTDGLYRVTLHDSTRILVHPTWINHPATMKANNITMSQLTPVPASIDPFAEAPPSHPLSKPLKTAKELAASADGSRKTISVDPDDPFYELVSDMVGDPAKVEQIADLIEKGGQFDSLHAKHQDAVKTGAQATARAQQAEAQVQTLQAALTQAQQLASQAAAALPAPQDDDGKPIPGAMTPLVDPAFVEPSWWTQDAMPLLAADQWGQHIVLEQGPAGVGKTYAPEQFAAKQGEQLAYIYLNCKTSDPHEFIEYRSIGDGGKTSFDMGPLAQAVAAKTSKPMLIVLDEFDTTPLEFQMRMAQVLEANPNQRKLVTTGNGTLRVGRHIQFILTANATGMNPASRHRGTIAPPILNRSVGVQVDLPTEGELTRILTLASPATISDNARVSTTVLRLMKAVERGELDLDVTLRTGIQAARMFALYGDWSRAWARALYNKMDDPAMAGKARDIVSEQF